MSCPSTTGREDLTPGVKRWLETTDRSSQYVSVITHGLRAAFSRWIVKLPLAGRCLWRKAHEQGDLCPQWIR